MVISRFSFALLIVSSSAFAQNRYFVSFKDKANSTYSTSDPLKFLSQRSIDRRTREGFAISTEDLPVDTAYLHLVRNTGASVYFSSRWFNGVLIQTDASTAAIVQSLPCVDTVELVAPGSRLNGARQNASNKLEQSHASTSLQNQTQLAMIGLDKMQAEGYHGEGINVAVFDAGFIGVSSLQAFKSIYKEGRLLDAFNFVINNTDVYSAHYHGTEVLSIMAADTAGYVGGAYKANYFLYQTEDVATEYRVEEYNWLFAAERADSAGVDVINSSLGYNTFDDPSMSYTYADMNGKTSVIARAAAKVTARGIVVVNSAGNEGDNAWEYIDTPADAVGVIACGSVDDTGMRSPFSSVGPSSDHRIKPDVAAMGLSDIVIDQTGAIVSGDGTSFSTPLVASLVVGLRQALPQASASEIYKRVITSASQAAHPDNLLGYGIPNFDDAKTLTNIQDDFVLYPNPVTDRTVNIFFKNPSDQSIQVTVFTTTGQQVIDFSAWLSWNNNPYVVDLSLLAQGLYLIKVQTTSASKTVRILKVN